MIIFQAVGAKKNAVDDKSTVFDISTTRYANQQRDLVGYIDKFTPMKLSQFNATLPVTLFDFNIFKKKLDANGTTVLIASYEKDKYQALFSRGVGEIDLDAVKARYPSIGIRQIFVFGGENAELFSKNDDKNRYGFFVEMSSGVQTVKTKTMKMTNPEISTALGFFVGFNERFAASMRFHTSKVLESSPQKTRGESKAITGGMEVSGIMNAGKNNPVRIMATVGAIDGIRSFVDLSAKISTKKLSEKTKMPFESVDVGLKYEGKHVGPNWNLPKGETEDFNSSALPQIRVYVAVPIKLSKNLDNAKVRADF
jgi:hypothetical protein